MSETTTTPVTVIGLGAMGQTLAATLLDNGHTVTVWNRTPGKAADVVARGARLVPTLADAAAGGELVLVCVLDSQSVTDVLASIGNAARGKVIVNLTTSTPDEARLAAVWAADHGAEYLDGVMMAVPSMIGSPEAMILYGGDHDAYRLHEAALRTLAGNSPFLGPDAGLPALYDVGLLSLLYATMAGWLQAFATVASAGVSAKEFLPYAQAWFDNVVVADDPVELAASIDRREYPDTVPSSLALNAAGLRLLVRAQDEAGVDSSMMASIGALAERRVVEGHGADGFASLIESIKSGAPS